MRTNPWLRRVALGNLYLAAPSGDMMTIRMALLSLALACCHGLSASAQGVLDQVYATCTQPNRWMSDVIAELQGQGWTLMGPNDTASVARLEAVIHVIETAEREGWSSALTASSERAEAEVQAWAATVQEGLDNRVANGIPFAIPPSEYATLLAPGGGVLEIETSPEFDIMYCVLRGLWKTGAEVAPGGHRLAFGAAPHDPLAWYAGITSPGIEGEITARFYDLEQMARAAEPAPGQAYRLIVETRKN